MSWGCWFLSALLRWEAFAALGTWAAVVVVWVQLKSIAEQVKLQANQLKLQTYVEYTKRYSAIVLNFPEVIFPRQSGHGLSHF
jgi:hypothetical protein